MRFSTGPEFGVVPPSSMAGPPPQKELSAPKFASTLWGPPTMVPFTYLPVAFMARTTFISPALYAALASAQQPNIAWRSLRYAAAAWVDLTGSRRSSTHRSTRSPYRRAVGAMNCQSPFAPARETAVGLNPLSIMAVYARSSGRPLPLKISRIIPR